MLKREELGRPLWILAGVLMVLLFVGTWLDLPVSRLLYADRETGICRFFSAVGELPAFLLFIMAGATWFVRRGRSSRFLEYFSVFASSCLVGAGTVFSYLALREDLLSISLVDGIVLTAAVLAFGVATGVLLTRNASRADCFRMIFSVLFACAASMLAVNLMKFPWSRPRFRLITAEPQEMFVPWWRPGGIGAGLGSDDYRSFPSGHTAMAACSILWTLFPAMHPRLEGTGRYWLATSCLWTAVVALSRIIMGAHYITDVAAAWLLILLMYLISVLFFWRDGPVFRWMYRLVT